MSNKVDIYLQPKQFEADEYLENGTANFLFYGGAKAGGKSFLVRAKEFRRRMKYAGTVGVIIRKTFPELLANHIRKMFVEYPYVKEWYRAGEKAIYYPNGSVTEFKYLTHTNDVYIYQGIDYDDITLDEATQHEEEVFKILKTSLRNDPKVIQQHPNYKPRFLLTGNPGGIGHQWVKRIFIDRRFGEHEDSKEYHFIQAKYCDNPIFMDANPGYLRNLQDLPEDLRRAYLDGDWSVFMGQFFSDFMEEVHVIEPFDIPKNWERLFSLDWGYSPHPFHCGWYAVDRENKKIYKYREYTDIEKSPADVAKEIIKLSQNDSGLTLGVGDSQMWEQNPFQSPGEANKDEVVTDKSIALQINDILHKANMHMHQANKSRITGWTNLKILLKWDAYFTEDNKRVFKQEPRYYIFKTCETTRASYPGQIHAKLRPGDMLKQEGDDPVDTDRYAIMAIQDDTLPYTVVFDDETLKLMELYENLPHVRGIPDWNKVFQKGAIMPEPDEPEDDLY